jgi:hypothetical protein
MHQVTLFQTYGTTHIKNVDTEDIVEFKKLRFSLILSIWTAIHNIHKPRRYPKIGTCREAEYC